MSEPSTIAKKIETKIEKKVEEKVQKQASAPGFEIAKIEKLPLNLEVTALFKFFPKGPYLAWQLTQESKEAIANQVPDQHRDNVGKFLAEHGHCTIIGNFGKENRVAFGGKKVGAVRGTLNTFPNLKVLLDQKEDQTPTTLRLTELLIANDGDVICAAIDAEENVVLRERLPTDQGISEDFLKGKSHITLWVNANKGCKPVDSNKVLLEAI